MFFRLKNISTYHSSFDFLSFLWGRQGRWYDPILQTRKLKLIASKKMCPVKWLRWVEPGLWSLHLELSPSQPATFTAIPRGPKIPRIALHAICEFPLLLYLSFPCYLVFFQVGREKNDCFPGGANSSFLWTLEGRDQSRPAESCDMDHGIRKERSSWWWT